MAVRSRTRRVNTFGLQPFGSRRARVKKSPKAAWRRPAASVRAGCSHAEWVAMGAAPRVKASLSLYLRRVRRWELKESRANCVHALPAATGPLATALMHKWSWRAADAPLLLLLTAARSRHTRELQLCCYTRALLLFQPIRPSACSLLIHLELPRSQSNLSVRVCYFTHSAFFFMMLGTWCSAEDMRYSLICCWRCVWRTCCFPRVFCLFESYRRALACVRVWAANIINGRAIVAAALLAQLPSIGAGHCGLHFNRRSENARENQPLLFWPSQIKCSPCCVVGFERRAN